VRFSAELQLMLLAAALYIYDCSHLLHANEGVMERRWGRWVVRLGSRSIRFAGKRFFLANMLTPHRPLYRLRWDFEQPRVKSAGTKAAELRAHPELMLLAPSVWAVFFAMFVLLPFALLYASAGANVLVAVATLYATILALVGLIGIRRNALGLSTRQAWALVFECLVCPPLAINALRKISLSTPCDESLVAAVHRLVDDEGKMQFDAQCVDRLDEEIDFEGEGSARASRLLAAKSQFAIAREDA